MLKTRVTEMFGIESPIMSAPMTMHSGGRLAAAVSKAGAIGSFGGIHMNQGPDWLRGEIDHIRAETDRPFGVGFITNFIPMFEGLFDATIEAKPPIVALSFGDPRSYIGRAKAAGASVMCQVQTFEDAQAAVAAGAVSSGRALAAVLAAGADGAWVGTALLPSPEAVEVRDGHKQKVIESDGEDTIFTEIYDRLSGAPWPAGIGGRVWKNRLVGEWTGREAELPANREAITAQYMAGVDNYDPEVLDIYMGQGAAAVAAVRPAADVLHQMCEDAERILRERTARLLK